MKRPPFALLAVGSLLAGGLAVATATEPKAGSDAAARADHAPVVGMLAVCPELVKAGSDVVTRMTVGTARAGEVEVHAATLSPAGGLGRRVLDRGGRVGVLDLRTDNALAVAVTARGASAGAVEVEQVSRGADGIQRGFANVRCEPTSQDTWFVGGATDHTADTQLVLVNPYDEPALVDLVIHTRDGVVDTPGATGLVVARRSRLVVKLADLVPEQPAIAVRVVAVEGRIAPAMRHARASGDTPLGVDWIPRAGQPATRLDLTGLPDGIGRRTLYLFAPGDDDAVVRVQATYADGQFVPDELEEIAVPADRVTAIDLTEIVSEVDQRTADRLNKPASLRILAEGAPVLASVMVQNYARFNRIREIAYVGRSEPLTGPSLITDNVTGALGESTIYLAAPDGPARVEIAPVGFAGRAAGPGRRYTVEVPQGRLVAFKVHERYRGGRLRPLSITPLEGSAPVFAGRLLYERGQRGPLLSVLSVVTQPSYGVPRPPVVADPRVALVEPGSGEP